MPTHVFAHTSTVTNTRAYLTGTCNGRFRLKKKLHERYIPMHISVFRNMQTAGN